MSTDFVDLLKKLLVSSEFNRTSEDAERLIKAYPSIVAQGIMAGPRALRATVMALEMADEHRQN